MTLKDYILIALGFVLGGYASLIASRIVVWLHLKHDTFYRIELVSGIINGQSFEFAPHAHKPDRLLEARAIEFYFHGHDAAYRECHKIADEVQTTLDRVASKQHPHYHEITGRKTDWLKRTTSLRPNFLAFLTARRRMDSVLDFYLSKESEYLRQARANIARDGGTVEDLR